MTIFSSSKAVLALTCGLLIFFIPERVYAYADPGIAGLLYQIVILVFGAVVGYFTLLRKHIRRIFRSIFKRDNDSKTD